ncbi:YbaB/EbfC family nucleoid-associated protein [Streptomyces sp. NPDC004457]|uniref:YbaB/EbfC family nucleoid-associated protein n=1 Tax=Streptomyces spinosus TaxID=2872623 RepID=UPI001CED70FF|nr:YbaB/EbfC family nucleoid-associated protein [Streptomyces spinosus]
MSGMDGNGTTGARGDAPDATVAANPFTASLSERLAETLAELDAVTTGLTRAKAELRDATYAARSRDRTVEATVGSQGQLLGLRFLDNKYRTMSPTELAASVLDAATQARDAMSRHVMRTMRPFTEPRPGMPRMEGFDIDWADIFGSGVLEEPQTSSSRNGRGALRDEIHEDGEE